MITVLRLLTLALVTVLTVFVTQAIGEEVDIDTGIPQGSPTSPLLSNVIEILKSADRSEREKAFSVVSIIKIIHAAEACEKFRVAIDSFEIHGGDAKGKVDSVFDSAFAAIDAAEGDHARKGADLAFDLAKGIGATGNNPWHLKAGFRVIYANVCERR